MQGLFPPSSRVTLFRLLFPAASLIILPTWNTALQSRRLNPLSWRWLYLAFKCICGLCHSWVPLGRNIKWLFSRFGTFSYQRSRRPDTNMRHQKNTHENRYGEEDGWSWCTERTGGVFHFNQNFMFLLLDGARHDPTITYLLGFSSCFSRLFILLLKSREFCPNWHTYCPRNLISVSPSMSTLTWASVSPTLPRGPADTGTLLRSSLCGVFADTTFPSSYTPSPMEPSWERIPSLPRIVLFANPSISQTDTASLVAVTKSCPCILLRTHCHSGGCLTLVACQVSLSPHPHPPSCLLPHLWTVELEKRNWIWALGCCFS